MNDVWNQDSFAGALTDRSRPVPSGITCWTAPLPLKRFNVYRGNFAGALCEALAARFPVVQRLVGEEFFRAMSREYALRNLPDSPVLISYGAEFPQFIAEFEPASSVPYLSDVARLESAHWEAYHAEDVAPIHQQAFAALDPETLGTVKFEMLPSVRIVTSQYPIVKIWQTNVVDAEVQPVELTVAEDALVLRPEWSVDVRNLPPGAALFLSLLKAGTSLAEAAGKALEALPAFDLSLNLAGLIRARAVAQIIL